MLDHRDDLQHWIETDRLAARRLVELIKAALRDPFTGLGKPEPLHRSAPGSGRAGSPVVSALL